MKYQSFIMRVLCLILIVGVVLGYNSMQKKDSDTEKDQQIASLTTRVEALEKQQDEILSAIEEAAKAQEEAKKKAEEEAKNKKDSAAKEEADAADKAAENQADADSEADSSDEAEESEDLAYKNGTYTGDGQGFGGNIQVQVTLENDTITDIQVVSAPGEDSAYLSQLELSLLP